MPVPKIVRHPKPEPKAEKKAAPKKKASKSKDD